MKRRVFIGSTVSALSMAMLDSSLIQAAEVTENLNKKLLERLVSAFEFKVFDACWSDSVFMKVFEETSQSFLKSNYKLSETKAFQITSLNLVLVPMKFKIASLGCVDWVFLFYEKHHDEQWKYVKSINAYEAVTILELVDSIAKQLPNGHLSEFLLPMYVRDKKSMSYTTRKGHVEMKIVLQSTGIEANIQVWNQSELLFQQKCNMTQALSVAV